MADLRRKRVGKNDTLATIKSYVFLDRHTSRMLHEQIRNGIELAIIGGDVPDGAFLPSVRHLAEALDVAPNTVARVYSDLRQEGFLRSSPKRGYFVRTIGDQDGTSRDQSHGRQILEDAVDAALAAGFDASTVLDIVNQRIKQLNSARQLVCIVGHGESFLAERVEWVKQSIADSEAEVIGVAFEELEQPHYRDQLEDVDVFLVPVGDWDEARRLIGHEHIIMLPMTRTLRPDVREFIMHRPPQTCFGIIEGNEDQIGRILTELHRLHPVDTVPIVATIQDGDAVRRAIRAADVLLVGGSVRKLFDAFGSIAIPRKDLVSVPDEKTLRLLRSRLGQRANSLK